MADVETNECMDNNGGCWQDKTSNITACKVRKKNLQPDTISVACIWQLSSVFV